MKGTRITLKAFILVLGIVFGSMATIGIILTAYVSVVEGAEIHVPGDYDSIQSAINASANADKVIVHPGTYYENIKFLGRVINVRSIDPNDPVVIAATVIEGDGTGRVVEFSDGEENESVLSGFTVQGGEGGIYCDGSSPTISNCYINYNAANYGGGIYCADSSPVITHCTINYNWTQQDDGGGIYCGANSSPAIINCNISNNSSYGDGGGIYCADSSPNISNSIISFNRANYGGGIYCDGPLVVDDCTISNNSSYDEGGGIFCDGILSLTNCTINNNSSFVDGGGVHCGDSSTIDNCTINDNSSYRYGGAVFCNGTLDITNCSISNNSSYDEGGAINCSGSVSVKACTISNNSSYGEGGGIYCGDLSNIDDCSIKSNSGYEGGGIYCYGALNVTNCTVDDNSSYSDGGGIYCGDLSEVTRCTFMKNIANQGGGVYCYGLLTMINCILSDNSSYNKGGAMYCDGSVSMTNCTISINFANQGGGIYYNGGSIPSTITNCILWADSLDEISGEGISPSVSFSNIYGGEYTGEGNIDMDPLFADPNTGDYHLMEDSPCINAGTIDGAPIRDKDGDFRDQLPDMGAYEYMNRPPQFDLIGNKKVDEGTKLHFKITATDPDGDPLTYSAIDLPYGAHFNPDTQAFSWKPSYSQSGTYTLNFTVTDTGSPPLSHSEQVTITVRNVKQIWNFWQWYPQGYQYSNTRAYHQPWYLQSQPMAPFPQLKPPFTQAQYQQLYQPWSYINFNLLLEKMPYLSMY